MAKQQFWCAVLVTSIIVFLPLGICQCPPNGVITRNFIQQVLYPTPAPRTTPSTTPRTTPSTTPSKPSAANRKFPLEMKALLFLVVFSGVGRQRLWLTVLVIVTIILLPTGSCDPPDSSHTKVDISNCKIHTIEQDAFKGGSIITILNLKNNILTQIPNGVFAELSNLVLLDLSNNRISTTSARTFTGLQSLVKLDLYENQLSQIPDGVFTPLSNLTELRLHKNKLTIISAQTFIGLHNLQELTLSDNKLTRIPDDGFGPLSNLMELQLYRNQISTISARSFTGLQNLRKLHLYDNKLTQISDDVFAQLSILVELHLDHNQISSISAHTFAGLHKLQKLKLNDNKLTQIPDDAFVKLLSLVSLNLGYNQLSSISTQTFSGLNSLRELFLYYNRMKYIYDGVFGQLSSRSNSLGNLGNISTLCLHGNMLQTLPGDLQGRMVHSSLNDVSLGKNPLHCSCELETIKQWASKGENCIFDTPTNRDFVAAYFLSCATPYVTVPRRTLSNVTLSCAEPSEPIISTNSSKNTMFIKCTSFSDPAPRIKWFTPNGSTPENLAPRDKTIYENSAVLKINQFGDYTCSAVNKAGYKVKTISIMEPSTIATSQPTTVQPTTIDVPTYVMLPLLCILFVILVIFIYHHYVRPRMSNYTNSKETEAGVDATTTVIRHDNIRNEYSELGFSHLNVNRTNVARHHFDVAARTHRRQRRSEEDHLTPATDQDTNTMKDNNTEVDYAQIPRISNYTNTEEMDEHEDATTPMNSRDSTRHEYLEAGYRQAGQSDEDYLTPPTYQDANTVEKTFVHIPGITTYTNSQEDERNEDSSTSLRNRYNASHEYSELGYSQAGQSKEQYLTPHTDTNTVKDNNTAMEYVEKKFIHIPRMTKYMNSEEVEQNEDPTPPLRNHGNSEEDYLTSPTDEGTNTKMASISANILSFLECPTCLEPYTNPKILPCSHTFCERCLKRHIQATASKGKFPCPSCQRWTKIPKNGVEGIDNNLFVNRLRDSCPIDAMTMCDICKLSDIAIETVSLCFNCEVRLCQQCTAEHKRRNKLNVDHCVMSMKDVRGSHHLNSMFRVKSSNTGD